MKSPVFGYNTVISMQIDFGCLNISIHNLMVFIVILHCNITEIVWLTGLFLLSLTRKLHMIKMQGSLWIVALKEKKKLRS